jgi:hypothetical protein
MGLDMRQAINIPRSYGYAVVLALMFQVSAWLLCAVHQSGSGEAETSDGIALNWRTWIISTCIYWLGFVAVFLTKREGPSLWRLVYTGLAFPVLFVAAARVVATVYGGK